MERIVLPDDESKILEKRFGPDVRKMGPWNSDGTFGYCSISVADMEKAAESVEDPHLKMALSGLQDGPERNERLIALLEKFGQPLIERTVAAYRQGSLEPASGGAPRREAARTRNEDGGGSGAVERVRVRRRLA